MLFGLGRVRGHLQELPENRKAALGFINAKFQIGQFPDAVGHEEFIGQRREGIGQSLKIALEHIHLGGCDELFFFR